ncbi:PilZ domain-containing protein [Salinarimonas ramus]|uniref:PilZ domain-containing protein n=1 Tax=Salinarimonas ramus TaxID=690164 RepID=A0A917Q7K7_9HYPH|nr:PilZ domain-containing protein [Salinarimonas ramus]GGK33884.1 hypothetical protein GCM10011322_20680 [Salinarimonas ramus]
MTETADPADHRTAPRRRALIAAKLSYGGGAVTVDCVVRNISQTGAKLALSEGITIPHHFEIVIPQLNAVHRAELRWRTGGEAGITFLDAQGASPSGDGEEAFATQQTSIATPGEEALKARIRRLEAEIVRLRARVAELGGT